MEIQAITQEDNKIIENSENGSIGIDNISPSGIESDTTEEEESCCLNNNSFIPALQECERFIDFLNKELSLKLPLNYVVTINKAKKNLIGFFLPLDHANHFINSNQNLNNINLNTLHLKDNSPYECLTHELAHFINYSNKIKDCTSNQYHNKHFKSQAEKLFLKVEKTDKGYCKTSETPEFFELLEKFKPNKEVFDIIQADERKEKKGSRLKLWMCACDIKIRSARELNIKCLDCNGMFAKDD